VNNNAYELDLPANIKIHPVVNISQLKHYREGVTLFPDRPTPLTRPEPVVVEDNGAEEWEVKRILDHRYVGRVKRLQYLVEWSGYPVWESTWEPLEHLDGALESVIEYNKKHKLTAEIKAMEVLDIEENQLNNKSWAQRVCPSSTQIHRVPSGGLFWLTLSAK
jgi:hypothetical protein